MTRHDDVGVSLDAFERAVLTRARKTIKRPPLAPLPSIKSQDRAVIRALVGEPLSQAETVQRVIDDIL